MVTHSKAPFSPKLKPDQNHRNHVFKIFSVSNPLSVPLSLNLFIQPKLPWLILMIQAIQYIAWILYVHITTGHTVYAKSQMMETYKYEVYGAGSHSYDYGTRYMNVVIVRDHRFALFNWHIAD